MSEDIKLRTVTVYGDKHVWVFEIEASDFDVETWRKDGLEVDTVTVRSAEILFLNADSFNTYPDASKT